MRSRITDASLGFALGIVFTLLVQHTLAPAKLQTTVPEYPRVVRVEAAIDRELKTPCNLGITSKDGFSRYWFRVPKGAYIEATTEDALLDRRDPIPLKIDSSLCVVDKCWDGRVRLTMPLSKECQLFVGSKQIKVNDLSRFVVVEHAGASEGEVGTLMLKKIDLPQAGPPGEGQ